MQKACYLHYLTMHSSYTQATHFRWLTFRLGVQAHLNTALVRTCTSFLIPQRQPGTIGYSGQKQQTRHFLPDLEELV